MALFLWAKQMAEKVGEIYYVVEAHTEALIAAERKAIESAEKMQAELNKTSGAAKAGGFKMKEYSRSIQEMGREAETAQRSILTIGNAIKALLTARAVSEVRQMADAWTGLQNRLRLVTDTQEELRRSVEDVFNIAQNSSQELDTIAQVYQRFAQNASVLGLSLEQVAEVTDTVAKAVAISGSSAASAQAALVQFGQALASGVLRGEELNSVMEQTPALAKAIADGMGITVGQLRAVAAEGKITSDVLIKALGKAASSVDEQFAKRVKTMEQAFTELGNAITKYVGERDEAIGASEALTEALGQVIKHVDVLAQSLVTIGSVALARYVTGLVTSMAASVKAALDAQRHAKAELDRALALERSTRAAMQAAVANKALGGSHSDAERKARQHAAALTGLQTAKAGVVTIGSRLLGLLGGPVGITAMVAAAAGSFLLMSKNAKEAKGDIDLLSVSLENLGRKQLNSLRIKLLDEVETMAGLGGEAAKTAAQIESLRMRLSTVSRANPNYKEWEKELAHLEGKLEASNVMIEAHKDRLKTVEKLQKELEAAERGQIASKRDPEAEKRLKAMREELELAKLTGEAKERLRAIQNLGDNASPEQKQEAAELAAQRYRYEEARKRATEATKEGSKAAKRDADAAKKNAEAVKQLEHELVLATLSGLELAEAKALSGLNEFATPGEIERVKFLAGALHEIEQAEKNRQLLGEHDPFAKEAMRYEEQLSGLRKLNEAKLIEDQRYLDLKGQAEREHAETMRVLHEENFRAQSHQNELLMASIDAFGASASSAISGLLVGLHSGTDAARMLGNAVLNEVVSSFVQMGVAQVKAWVMGRAAQSAAAAGYLASVMGQVQANTALAAQAAFASTAAIPLVGPALAPAAAATAATAAGALGAPAIAGASASIAGGRQYGGPVAAGKMYRINENGAPEVYNAANGQQFLLPNARGEVVSNKEAVRSSAQSSPRITVNLIEDASRGGQVEQSIGAENEQVITAFVADIRGGGQASQALEATYGLRRQGR